jgi:hypothetical protein
VSLALFRSFGRGLRFHPVSLCYARSNKVSDQSFSPPDMDNEIKPVTIEDGNTVSFELVTLAATTWTVTIPAMSPCRQQILTVQPGERQRLRPENAARIELYVHFYACEPFKAASAATCSTFHRPIPLRHDADFNLYAVFTPDTSARRYLFELRVTWRRGWPWSFLMALTCLCGVVCFRKCSGNWSQPVPGLPLSACWETQTVNGLRVRRPSDPSTTRTRRDASPFYIGAFRDAHARWENHVAFAARNVPASHDFFVALLPEREPSTISIENGYDAFVFNRCVAPHIETAAA